MTKPSLEKNWKCGKCGVGACPKKCPDPDNCLSDGRECQGLICECDNEGGGTHGLIQSDPCPEANCYHCGWGGRVPAAPKKMLPWEKKALEAGWTPPEGWGQ